MQFEADATYLFATDPNAPTLTLSDLQVSEPPPQRLGARGRPHQRLAALGAGGSSGHGRTSLARAVSASTASGSST